MKKLLVIVAVAMISCSKTASKPEPQAQTLASVFSSSEVVFEDYSYGVSQAGSTASVFVDLKLSGVNGLKTVELIRSQPNTVAYDVTPTNGTLRLYDHKRGDTISRIAYRLRFTRTDNTTFETGNFNVRK